MRDWKEKEDKMKKLAVMIFLCFIIVAPAWSSQISNQLVGWEKSYAAVQRASESLNGNWKPKVIRSDSDLGSSAWSWVSASGMGYSAGSTILPYRMSGFTSQSGYSDHEIWSGGYFRDQLQNRSSARIRLEFDFRLHGDLVGSPDNTDRWDMSFVSNNGSSWSFIDAQAYFGDFNTNRTFRTGYINPGWYLPIQFAIWARVHDNDYQWNNTAALTGVRAYDESGELLELDDVVVSSMQFGRSPVPEPGSFLLLGIGLVGLARIGRE